MRADRTTTITLSGAPTVRNIMNALKTQPPLAVVQKIEYHGAESQRDDSTTTITLRESVNLDA